MDDWLQVVKEVLIQEGFQDTILQVRKPGQVFGLIRKLDNTWEMHVRGFDDGRLESEIEISRDYFEHFNDEYRTEATSELTQILDAYRIPYEIKGNPNPSKGVLYLPKKTLVPWKPLAAIAGLVAFLGFLNWLSKRKEVRAAKAEIHG